MDNELSLKRSCVRLLREHLAKAVIFLHEPTLGSSKSIPDISVTWLNRTSWWEFKYGDPTFKLRGDQELSLLRLAAAGSAHFIIYETRGDVRRTLIVHPRRIGDLKTDHHAAGWNHAFVVESIERFHREGKL
jgi:hypothetical protein